MNASEPRHQGEETEPVSDIGHIHAAMLQARARQRRLYLLGGLFLLLGAFFMLGLIAFSNGTVIEVAPEDAKNTSMVQIVSGLGIVVDHTVYSLSKTPTVKISATGFKTLQKTLHPSETGSVIRVELSELPGQIHLGTSPSSEKTRWFINGKMESLASTLQKELFSGQYNIDIDSPYYRKKSVPLTVERGKVLDRIIDLEQITGQLNIQTVPAGANIRINNEAVGISPLSLTRSGGSYHLEITLGDYQTIAEDIEITNSEQLIERDYRLALKHGYLNISLSPTGGILLLNGKKVDISSTGTSKLAVQARINNTLSYLKAGYFPRRKDIMIEPGLEKTISLHLKPETGVVDIQSKPAASVFINGKPMGQTPLMITLPAINHRIELRRKGYRSYTKHITPGSKSTQKVRAVLRTQLQARLAESPVEMNNSIGMALKLFKPDDTFVMGAPRHEKGQRANEFLRTVKLKKAFYISKFEVTVGQYGQFRQSRGSPNEPVTSVSWIEAAEFCNWLSRREKLTPFYEIRDNRLRGFHPTSDGYRLPSEAEWEWLARKAAKPRQSKFTWGDATTIPPNSGNIADEQARGTTAHFVPNYSDGYAGLAPAGSYPPDKSGLYDLTGNVSEWVHDIYSLLPSDGQKTEIDPLGANTGEIHTLKGSNWRSGSITELRASFRDGAKNGRDDLGFRVARYVYGGSHAKE